MLLTFMCKLVYNNKTYVKRDKKHLEKIAYVGQRFYCPKNVWQENKNTERKFS